jgi:hypothetical protein
MNTEMLYELYEITEKNDAPDLATVGMAMLLEKHPEITHEESRAMREFTGRHGQELAAAYPDREAFAAAVEAGIQADKEAAEQVEQEHE